MVVHNDRLVPNEQTLDLFERAGEPKKVVMLRGINHHDVYSGEPFETTMNTAVEWFNEHI
jgi:alpha-beta hydrolase superfamily lysophospholipase